MTSATSWPVPPAQRVQVGHLLVHLRVVSTEPFVALGANGAEGNSVTADAGRPVVDRDCPGESLDGGLGVA